MKNLNEYKRRFYTLMESTIGDVKPLISEQVNKDTFIEELKNQGFTLTISAGYYIAGKQTKGDAYILTKNGLEIVFIGDSLIAIKITDRYDPSNMGSDNLQNKDLSNAFKAYSNSDKVLDIPNANEVGDFAYWYAPLNVSTIGKTKESTPFYKYYSDILKLSGVSAKYTNFNNAKVKDQLKMVGGELKKGFNQIKGAIKQRIGGNKEN